eukprot:m.173483 g.173483  ORF g.173483 m.173483 type:complete len:828 (-) comp13702_c0_seq1:244-2727(-)
MATKIKELHSHAMIQALSMQIKRFISSNELASGKDEQGTGSAIVLHQARILNTILRIGNLPTNANYKTVVAKCKDLLSAPEGCDQEVALQIKQFLIIISFPMRMAEAQSEYEAKPIPSKIQGLLSTTWNMSEEEMLAQAIGTDKDTDSGGPKREEFFAGKMPRAEAEDVLSTRVNSTFLLRESETQSGAYTISVRDSNQVFHFRIGTMESGHIFIDPQQPFDDFEGLVVYLQSQQSIGGYPAKLRIPYNAPESHIDYVEMDKGSTSKGNSGDTHRSGHHGKMRASAMFDKDVAMLQHQRAVSAAKGAVLLLYARTRDDAPDKDNFVEHKVAWIKENLTLLGWRVWIEADHVERAFGPMAARQIVLSAVETASVVIGCISSKFLVEGSYVSAALEHARQQKQLNGRVFTIRIREAPILGGIFAVHVRKTKEYDQRFLMNSFWVKQLHKDIQGHQLSAAASTRRIVGALSCDFIGLREEEGADIVFGETGKVIQGIPDLFHLSMLSDSTEAAAKAAAGAIVLSYDWGPRVAASFPVQDLVVRFAGLLEQNGYLVLMDTFHTDGDIEDIMEIAIKRSAVVLACVSDGYCEPGTSSEKEWQLAKSEKELGQSLFVVNLHKPSKLFGTGQDVMNNPSDHIIFTSTSDDARFDLSACVNDGVQVTPHAISQLSLLFKALDERGVRQHYPAGKCYSPVAVVPSRGDRKARGRSKLSSVPLREELSDLPYYVGAQSALLCRTMLGTYAKPNEFLVRKMKPRSQDCKVYAVMVYQGKEDGIFERLIHLEQGKYFFAESEAGGVRVAFDSIADAIARIPNAQKIAQEVVEKLLRQTE